MSGHEPVVAHLLDADESTKLVALHEHTATLLRSDGTLVEVVDAGSHGTAELVEHLQAAVDATDRRIVLVVLGGDDQHREAASNARPVFGSRRIEVCGIDRAGTVWWDAQTKPKSATVQRLAAFDPLAAAPVDLGPRLQPMDALPRPEPPRSVLRTVLALGAIGIAIAIAVALIDRQPRLAPTTTHALEEVGLRFDAPIDLGPPTVTQEEGGFAYVFGDDEVSFEVLALPHANPITDPAVMRAELEDWVDPDAMDEDVASVADAPWPTLERAMVRRDGDAVAITWWQVGPHHHVVLTAHHPSVDEANALRDILRTLRE